MAFASISLRLIGATCALGALNGSAFATTYYVSNTSNASDNYDGRDSSHASLSNSGPWRTLDKVNRTVVAGDVVYLAKGSVWEETLIPKSKVVYDAYGTGNKPLIRGSRNVGGLNWSNPAGDHVYVADVSSLNAAVISQLYLNGARMIRARHPNVGSGAYNVPHSRYLSVALDTPGNASQLKIEPNALTSSDIGNATLFVRTNSYSLSQYQVTGFDGQVISTTPLSAGNYDIKGGWGYWLENKRWMLDSANEWFHDTVNKKLYVWMPNSDSPAWQPLYAAVQQSGIAATGITSTSIRNIEVAETSGDGIKLVNAVDTTLYGLDVNRAGARGISLSSQSSNNAIISNGGTLDNLRVNDSVSEGIWMGDFRWGTGSANINLTNSTITNAGRGYYANSAVMMGANGTAGNNTIIGASYIGLFAWRGSKITGNYISNSCAEFDDCAGIYAIGRGEIGRGKAYPLNLTIEKNLVISGTGSPDGRGPKDAVATTGIYLDDYARMASVNANFVMDMDVGILLHFARDITVSGNTTFKNRVAEVWMQENTDTFDCTNIPATEVCNSTNFLMRNTITGNTLVSALDGPAVWMSSNYDSTSDFAAFTGNSYASLRNRDIVKDEVKGSVLIRKTLDRWKAFSGQDQTSTVFSTVPTIAALAGATPLVDVKFDQQPIWDTSDAVGSFGTEGGNPYMYVDVRTNAAINGLTGRRVSVLSSPLSQLFSTAAGQAYLLTFDARSTVNGDVVYPSLVTPYDGFRAVSNQGVVSLTTAWQHFTVPVVANANASGSVRLNLEIGSIVIPNSSVTSKLSFDNVKLVAAAVTNPDKDGAFALLNPGSTATSFPCPATNQARCSEYIDVKTGTSVTFPVTVAAKSGKVVAWAKSPWRDTDGDGIPGDGLSGQDQCGSTPINTGVDPRGCVVGQ